MGRRKRLGMERGRGVERCGGLLRGLIYRLGVLLAGTLWFGGDAEST